MHRSGTSAITRVFSILGADLPRNLLGANPTNESGHWESSDLMILHDDLLATAGSRWDDWCAFNPDWIRCGVAEGYKRKLHAFLQSDFGSSALFVIKDPRICRFVPLWLDVIEQFGAEARIVIPIRNPLEVAASLKRRDNFPPAKSYLLWLRHVLDAEEATRQLPRAIVTYDHLLDDWRRLVGTVAEKTGLHWPRRSSRSELEIDQFLRVALRHHAMDPAQLTLRADVSDWVKEAYHILHQMADSRETKDQFKRLDQIRSEFDKASATFGGLLASEVEQSEAQLRLVETRITMRDDELARLSGELTQARSALGAAQSALAASHSQAASLTAEIEATRAAVHECTQLLANDRQKEVDRLSAELASTQSTIRNRDREVERLSRDIEATRRCLRESQAEIQSLAGEHDNARAEAEQANAEHRRVSEEKHLIAAQFTAARDEIAVLKAALQAARRDADWKEERINDLARDLRAAAAQAVWAERVETVLLAANREKDEITNAPAAIRESAAAQTARAERAEAALLAATLEKDVLGAGLAAEVRRLEESAASRNAFYASAMAESEAKARAQLRSLEDRIVEAEAAHAKERREGKAPPWIGLLWSWKERRLGHELVRSGLFDAAWYVCQYPETASDDRSPVEHYLAEGYLRGYRPNPLFDSRWYLEHYEDVRRAGVNPLLHYMQHGFREGRDPGPNFQTDLYLEANPELRRDGINPLVHYLRHGHEKDG
jgi:hypothetical protein